jgi:hypothetical protein
MNIYYNFGNFLPIPVLLLRSYFGQIEEELYIVVLKEMCRQWDPPPPIDRFRGGG